MPLSSEPTSAEPARPPWLVRVEHRLGADGAATLVDAVIAIACFALFTGPLLLGVVDRQGPLAAQAAFGLIAAAPLVLRRRSPIGVLACITAVLVAATLLGVQFTPFVSDAGPVFPIAVYTVAAMHRRYVSLSVSVTAAVITWIGAAVAFAMYTDIDQDAVQAVLAVPAWLIGNATRGRREFQREIGEQERRWEEERQRRRRVEEHLQLSREVHDVVSHSLSMIAVRSGIGRVVFDEQPDEARHALATIETASRKALADLRGLLRDIRTTASGTAAPAPGLADLPALAAQIRDDGVAEVRLTEEGRPRSYPPAVDLSGYRIVQEAVTNVVKHAPGASVTVRLTHRPTELVLTVTDDGGTQPATAPVGAGLGLAGIRERAELLGGAATAGPDPDGGFTVQARLPIVAATDPAASA
ncbi:histidine kinase [Gordonia sp. HY285]|uniref:sensor histidine kinase n=1 Tax=Gordonia liuliyuniae TaxID=2911517 RepID=UPI001F021760|nr:histidine kinase [Gordonia liuliyuniae]MCF8608645.1 histidine kinase [Gordonia liuliyuniae]